MRIDTYEEKERDGSAGKADDISKALRILATSTATSTQAAQIKESPTATQATEYQISDTPVREAGPKAFAHLKKRARLVTEHVVNASTSTTVQSVVEAERTQNTQVVHEVAQETKDNLDTLAHLDQRTSTQIDENLGQFTRVDRAVFWLPTAVGYQLFADRARTYWHQCERASSEKVMRARDIKDPSYNGELSFDYSRKFASWCFGGDIQSCRVSMVSEEFTKFFTSTLSACLIKDKPLKHQHQTYDEVGMPSIFFGLKPYAQLEEERIVRSVVSTPIEQKEQFSKDALQKVKNDFTTYLSLQNDSLYDYLSCINIQDPLRKALDERLFYLEKLVNIRACNKFCHALKALAKSTKEADIAQLNVIIKHICNREPEYLATRWPKIYGELVVCSLDVIAPLQQDDKRFDPIRTQLEAHVGADYFIKYFQFYVALKGEGKLDKMLGTLSSCKELGILELILVACFHHKKRYDFAARFADSIMHSIITSIPSYYFPPLSAPQAANPKKLDSWSCRLVLSTYGALARERLDYKCVENEDTIKAALKDIQSLVLEYTKSREMADRLLNNLANVICEPSNLRVSIFMLRSVGEVLGRLRMVLAQAAKHGTLVEQIEELSPLNNSGKRIKGVEIGYIADLSILKDANTTDIELRGFKILSAEMEFDHTIDVIEAPPNYRVSLEHLAKYPTTQNAHLHLGITNKRKPLTFYRRLLHKHAPCDLVYNTYTYLLSHRPAEIIFPLLILRSTGEYYNKSLDYEFEFSSTVYLLGQLSSSSITTIEHKEEEDESLARAKSEQKDLKETRSTRLVLSTIETILPYLYQRFAKSATFEDLSLTVLILAKMHPTFEMPADDELRRAIDNLASLYKLHSAHYTMFAKLAVATGFNEAKQLSKIPFKASSKDIHPYYPPFHLLVKDLTPQNALELNTALNSMNEEAAYLLLTVITKLDPYQTKITPILLADLHNKINALNTNRTHTYDSVRCWFEKHFVKRKAHYKPEIKANVDEETRTIFTILTEASTNDESAYVIDFQKKLHTMDSSAKSGVPEPFRLELDGSFGQFCQDHCKSIGDHILTVCNSTISSAIKNISSTFVLGKSVDTKSISTFIAKHLVREFIDRRLKKEHMAGRQYVYEALYEMLADLTLQDLRKQGIEIEYAIRLFAHTYKNLLRHGIAARDINDIFTQLRSLARSKGDLNCVLDHFSAVLEYKPANAAMLKSLIQAAQNFADSSLDPHLVLYETHKFLSSNPHYKPHYIKLLEFVSSPPIITNTNPHKLVRIVLTHLYNIGDVKLLEHLNTCEDVAGILKLMDSTRDPKRVWELISLFGTLRIPDAIHLLKEPTSESIGLLLALSRQCAECERCQKLIEVLCTTNLSDLRVVEHYVRINGVAALQNLHTAHSNDFMDAVRTSLEDRMHTPCFNYNLIDVKQKIDEIVALSGPAQGKLPSRRRKALYKDFITVIAMLNEQKVFKRGEEELSVKDLTPDEFKSLIARCRAAISKPGITIERRHKFRLLAAALSLKATLNMTGKEVRPVQLIALLNSLHTNDNIMLKIATGEGKGIVATLHNIMLYCSGETVEVLTANDNLGMRDRAEFRPIYEYLDIPVAEGIITPTSQRADYVDNGINYGTRSGFSLFRSNMALAGEKLPENVAAVVDEVDAMLTCPTEDRLATTVSNTYNDKKGWKALYKLIHQFVRDERLFLNNDVSLDEHTKNLRTYIKKYAESKEDQDAAKVGSAALAVSNMLPDTRLQSLIVAALDAQAIRNDVDFILSQKEVEYVGKKGVKRKTVKVAAPRTEHDKNFNPSVSWSKGVQQFVHTKTHIEHGEQCVIEPITDTIATLNPKNACDRYHNAAAQVIGLTATLGAQVEQMEFFDQYRFMLFEYPRHHASRLEDLGVEAVDDINTALLATCNAVYKDGNATRPVVIICPSPAAVKETVEALSIIGKNDILGEDGFNIQMYTGELNTADLPTIVKNAGKSGYITIGTEMLGRGVDIDTEHEDGVLVVNTVAKGVSVSDVLQIMGRTARNAKAGSFKSILNKEDLGLRGDVTAEAAAARFRVMQEKTSADRQARRQQDIPLNEVRSFLTFKLLDFKAQIDNASRVEYGIAHSTANKFFEKMASFNEELEIEWDAILNTQHEGVNLTKEEAQARLINTALRLYNEVCKYLEDTAGSLDETALNCDIAKLPNVAPHIDRSELPKLAAVAIALRECVGVHGMNASCALLTKVGENIDRYNSSASGVQWLVETLRASGVVSIETIKGYAQEFIKAPKGWLSSINTGITTALQMSKHLIPGLDTLSQILSDSINYLEDAQRAIQQDNWANIKFPAFRSAAVQKEENPKSFFNYLLSDIVSSTTAYYNNPLTQLYGTMKKKLLLRAVDAIITNIPNPNVRNTLGAIRGSITLMSAMYELGTSLLMRDQDAPILIGDILTPSIKKLIQNNELREFILPNITSTSRVLSTDQRIFLNAVIAHAITKFNALNIDGNTAISEIPYTELANLLLDTLYDTLDDESLQRVLSKKEIQKLVASFKALDKDKLLALINNCGLGGFVSLITVLAHPHATDILSTGGNLEGLQQERLREPIVSKVDFSAFKVTERDIKMHVQQLYTKISLDEPQIEEQGIYDDVQPFDVSPQTFHTSVAPQPHADTMVKQNAMRKLSDYLATNHSYDRRKIAHSLHNKLGTARSTAELYEAVMQAKTTIKNYDATVNKAMWRTLTKHYRNTEASALYKALDSITEDCLLQQGDNVTEVTTLYLKSIAKQCDTANSNKINALVQERSSVENVAHTILGLESMQGLADHLKEKLSNIRKNICGSMEHVPLSAIFAKATTALPVPGEYNTTIAMPQTFLQRLIEHFYKPLKVMKYDYL